MSVDEAVIAYYLTAKKSEILYDTIEISHPVFSQTFRLVRNCRRGLTAQGENYEYCPMSLKRTGSSASLEQTMELTIGDTGKIIYTEYRQVVKLDGMRQKPSCIYRGYRSSNLNEPIYFAKLEMSDMILVPNGMQATISAPVTNATGTGERYTEQRFPMLREFLK